MAALPGPDETPVETDVPPAAADDASRLKLVADVSAELAAADTLAEVVDVSVRHTAVAVHAAVATLMLRDGDRLVLAGEQGLQPGVAAQWDAVPVDGSTPAGEAVARGRPVVVAGLAEVVHRYPALEDYAVSDRSVVCLPLVAGRTSLGVIGLTFDGGWVPGPRELTLLRTLADACAQALRRVRATEEAAERAAQLTFLADASAELSRSLDYRATLARVARLAVPRLADWCAISMVQDGRPVTLEVAHADPAKVAWAWELERRYPPDPEAPTGVPAVLRTGQSELIAEITDDMLVAGARDAEHLRLARGLNLRSAIVAPLTARGRTLGAITLIRAETDRRYGPADLAVIEDLGRRAGQAIDNAVLFGRTRDVARQLSRAVLPEKLDGIDGWEIATVYRPGGTAQVGGDFYDAVPLPGGRLAVVIGDVMGHGVAAAAAMAHMRAAVRAYLSVDPEPSVVVSKLDLMFERLELTRMVTLVYAVIDPATRRLDLVNAGHHPPVLVDADGATLLAEAVAQRPLGAGGEPRLSAGWRLRPGHVVVLYTDGLVERRGESADDGTQLLVAKAAQLCREPLADGLRHLVETVGSDDVGDDVTALALRVP